MKKYQDISIRKTPTGKVLDWRKQYLHAIQNLEFDKSHKNAPLFEKGNSKIGEFSDRYDEVLVWNLPVVVTCPGASKWCLDHCYNADPRKYKFPINKWNKNLQYFLSDPESLKSELLKILEDRSVKRAIRIHSSGDFFSNNYIDFWADIICKTPHIKYWAYTRSWTLQDMIPHLEALKDCQNIQLFASHDLTMNPAPHGWRKSIVYNDEKNLPNTGIICPEQSGKAPNCATCNYCLIEKNKNADVFFILH